MLLYTMMHSNLQWIILFLYFTSQFVFPATQLPFALGFQSTCLTALLEVFDLSFSHLSVFSCWVFSSLIKVTWGDIRPLRNSLSWASTQAVLCCAAPLQFASWQKMWQVAGSGAGGVGWVGVCGSSVSLERIRVLLQPALIGEEQINKANAVVPCLSGIKGSV